MMYGPLVRPGIRCRATRGKHLLVYHNDFSVKHIQSSSTVCTLDDHICQFEELAMSDRLLGQSHLRQGLVAVQAFRLVEVFGVDPWD